MRTKPEKKQEGKVTEHRDGSFSITGHLAARAEMMAKADGLTLADWIDQTIRKNSRPLEEAPPRGKVVSFPMRPWKVT